MIKTLTLCLCLFSSTLWAKQHTLSDYVGQWTGSQTEGNTADIVSLNIKANGSGLMQVHHIGLSDIKREVRFEASDISVKEHHLTIDIQDERVSQRHILLLLAKQGPFIAGMRVDAWQDGPNSVKQFNLVKLKAR